MEDKFKMGILDTIKGVADRFLKAGPAESAMMRTGFKQTDEYNQLMEDDQALSEVYTAAILDPDIGKNKIDALFSKLGIDVPEDEPAQKPAA